MIYFIQDQSRNHIKIGFTEGDDAQARLRALQTGSSTKLVLLLEIEGTRADEKKLHEQFASARECGEWFRPTPELLQFIIREADFRGYEAGHAQGLMHLRTAKEEQEACKTAIANTWPLRIYLAGKITKGCWRHSVVEGLRSALSDLDFSSCPSARSEQVPDWPVLSGSIFGEHHYVGPFFASCDHGCNHGDDSHGLGVQDADQIGGITDSNTAESSKSVVFNKCLMQSPKLILSSPGLIPLIVMALLRRSERRVPCASAFGLLAQDHSVTCGLFMRLPNR